MNVELAKRAVACKGWRWMPGMRAIASWTEHHAVRERVIGTEHDDDGEAWLITAWDDEVDRTLASAAVPDLNDPATLGCIEHGLLPELYGCEVSVCFWHDAWWLVRHDDSHTMRSLSGWPQSKVEALVAALEAAP